MAHIPENFKTAIPFIEDLVPRHIQDSGSLIVKFLESYYEWMESEGNVNDRLRKVDSVSLDDSIKNFYGYIKDELTPLLPANTAASDELVARFARELYTTKGSIDGIKSAFRILYGKEANVFLPSEYLFKPSAAKWVRDFAFQFRLETGEVPNEQDVVVDIESSTGFKQSVNSLYILPIGNGLYEVKIPRKIVLPDVELVISTSTFTGSLVRTITGKKILSKGKNYKVGDIYGISTTDGSGTIIKVTRVEGSGLRGFDIIKFGSGYLTDFNYRLSNSPLTITEEKLNLTITNGAVVSALSSPDKISGLVDDYKISRFTYLQSLNYLEDNSYVGEVVSSGRTEVSGDQLDSFENYADIAFTLGYVYEYPGYYDSNEGIISGNSKIRDGEYWQQYSYVIKSEKQYQEYSDTIKKLVHPAGLRMFGEYDINNKIELLLDVQTFIDTFKSIIVDSSKMSDEVQRKDFIKNIIYDDFDLDINGNSDGLIINEAGDEADVGPGYEKFNVLEQIAIELQRAAIELDVNGSDDATISLSKNLTELQNITESLVNTFSKYLTEDSITFETISRTITKNVMVRRTYPVEYKYSTEAIAMSSEDILSTGDGDVFGMENIDSELILTYSLDQIMMSETDTLDLGNGDTFSTYAGEYVEEDETYSNLAANIIFDLDVGSGITLAIPNTNIVIPEDDALLITDDEELDSFRVRNIGGVFLNPYYSSTELINNNIPYWHYGYTINERIIQ